MNQMISLRRESEYWMNAKGGIRSREGERGARETSGKTDIDSRTCSLLRECRKPGPLARSLHPDTRAGERAGETEAWLCLLSNLYVGSYHFLGSCWVADAVSLGGRSCFFICAPNMDVVMYFFSFEVILLFLSYFSYFFEG